MVEHSTSWFSEQSYIEGWWKLDPNPFSMPTMGTEGVGELVFELVIYRAHRFQVSQSGVGVVITAADYWNELGFGVLG